MSVREEITLLRAIAVNTGGGEVPGDEYEEVELYKLICSNRSGTPGEGGEYELIRVLEGISEATAP